MISESRSRPDVHGTHDVLLLDEYPLRLLSTCTLVHPFLSV